MTIANDSRVYYDPYDAGHQRGSVSDVPPPPRRGADLLQRAATTCGRCRGTPTSRRALVDWETFSNSRSDILEIIKSGFELPSGVVMFEDPPAHTMHRGLMSRVFTPRRMSELEDQVREYCRACLDPLVGADRFDFVKDLGRADADARHRHAARHPRERPARGAPQGRRAVAHRDGQADGGAADGDRRRIDVRRVHRVARAAPVRRPDDRVAQRGVRGRHRHRAQRSAATKCSPTRRSSRARATRRPAGSSVGSAECSATIPTSAARSSRTAH